MASSAACRRTQARTRCDHGRNVLPRLMETIPGSTRTSSKYECNPKGAATNGQVQAA
jgi:hypothetical protein